MKRKRIVAISPHSDDVELGCAGYLAKAIAQGHDVIVVLVLAQSINAFNGERISYRRRLDEFRESMDELRVTNWKVLIESSDADFDLATHPKSDVVKQLDSIICGAFTPTPNTDVEVLLPVPSFHQEHQYVYECSIAATRPTKGTLYRPSRVLAYTYPGGSWGPSSAFDTSKGGLYVDITGDPMDRKLRALAKHKSQNVQAKSQLISIDSVAKQCAYWGCEIGVGYAELLYFLRGFEQ